MMDWNGFRARAKAVVPSQELKPKRCWIGVLSNEKSPNETLEETDFVWMIGHNKIPIQKIHETYQKRHEDLDFHLKFEDVIVDNGDTVRSFLPTSGDLVLFLACSPEQSQIPESSDHVASVCSALRSPALSPARRVKNEPEASPVASRAKSTIPPLTPRPAGNEPAVKPLEGLVENTPPRSVDTMTPAAPETGADDMQSQSTASPPRTSPPSGIASGSPPDHGQPTPQSAIPPGDLGVKDESRSRSPPVFHHMDEETQAPFDPENFFNRDPSPDQDSQDQPQPTDKAIREIIARQDPKTLEAGVSQSLTVLNSLKSNFARYTETIQDASAWIQSINTLIPRAERKRTIVGVVGNTGAGKSSVINAMLDEERLVPTNCMRACTAVVTEMSWNSSTDSSSKYRAEIEFITPEDWKKELDILLKEFLTGSGALAREAADESTDAGIAWAKFHSVYPRITRDCLDKCTVEGLMAEREVLTILGTTKKISTFSPDVFYRSLQKFVDSKEKVTKKDKDKDKEKQKKKFDMEYWPLIKVVRIYVKAPALSTGAVIVDLPGVHDSNAARAAVAQGYMKQCTGLWIVAPINRAVDDKAAKTLLGESFKRQLKYDGGLSSVTFICSKTDDISVTEAIDTLELEEEVEELYSQERQFEEEIKDLQAAIEDILEEQEVHRIAQRDASDDIDRWDRLKDRLAAGETVFAPKTKANKRKKQSLKQSKTQKRHHRSGDDSDDDVVVSDDEASVTESDSDADDEAVQAPARPLTEIDIKGKMEELRESKKNARRTSSQLKLKIVELKPRIKELKEKVAATKAEISRICIAGRNDYSKRAIQQDFAAGIKELDQENAAEEDEDNFNPDEELRDYEEVARSLPVFCVSSRAYQQMCGRLKKDDAVPGFKTAEETEMPQLQAHCTKLTEAGRVQTGRTFLLSVCQQLTTFLLWASNDGTGLKMTDDDRRKQVRYLEKRLNELDKGLEESVRSCLNIMKKEMNKQIFDRYPDLIDEAIQAAPNTAQKWGANKAVGGLAWGTYKAVVRRNGEYQSPTAGLRDFNADLVGPIIKKLATGWERAFQNRLPKAFDGFVKDSGKLLHNFHEAVEERARSNGVGLASLQALKMQIATYEQLFAELNQILVQNMTELQREANRDFTPTIAAIMHGVYDLCANEHGMGSYKRMKEHMSAQVDRNRHTMFNNATLTVKRHLESMCKTLENMMSERADEIFVKMEMDYMRVLGDVQINPGAIMPKEERTLRAETMKILRSVDAQFEPIARGEFVDPDSSQDDVNASANIPIAVDDDNDDDSAFESARESADRDGNEDSLFFNDDTMITEPTPSKPSSRDVDMENSSEKENRGLRTPSEDDMEDDYDEDEL